MELIIVFKTINRIADYHLTSLVSSSYDWTKPRIKQATYLFSWVTFCLYAAEFLANVKPENRRIFFFTSPA